MHMGASGKGFREGSNESSDQIMAELVNEETVSLCYRAFQINDRSLIAISHSRRVRRFSHNQQRFVFRCNCDYFFNIFNY